LPTIGSLQIPCHLQDKFLSCKYKPYMIDEYEQLRRPRELWSRAVVWMVGIFIVILLMAVIPGCSRSVLKEERGFALREGDLLFQDLDCGSLCDAIEKVTTGYHGANFSHVGIVAKDDNGNFVVFEAVQNGVQAAELQSFLDRSFDVNGRPKVVVGRLKRRYRYLIPSALKQARHFKAKPYDRVFAIGNESYYCSELIYEIFLRANDNNPVFTLQPMTFNDPETGTVFPAWKEYFSRLDVSIPQDRPGINPGGISRSPVLTIIYAYGVPGGWEKTEPIGR